MLSAASQQDGLGRMEGRLSLGSTAFGDRTAIASGSSTKWGSIRMLYSPTGRLPRSTPTRASLSRHPIFGDLPKLPTPLGTALYPQFQRLPLLERATAVGLLDAFVDFDGTPESWRRYDGMSARELFSPGGAYHASCMMSSSSP